MERISKAAITPVTYMWHSSFAIEIACHAFVTTVSMTSNWGAQICAIRPIRVNRSTTLKDLKNHYSQIFLRNKGWSGLLVVDDLRNFTSWFKACCNLHFPIVLTMFICSIYNAIHIYASSQLRIKLIVNSIRIHAAMYMQCRGGFVK